MIRKIVKQGNGAYTISLPKKWIKENRLDFSDDLDLEDIDNKIIIKPAGQAKKHEESIAINLQYDSPEAYRSLLGSLYRGGFDTIKINFNNKKIITNLVRAVNTMYGFEIFYDDKNNCFIKSIYNYEDINVHSLVQKIIYTIKMMQEIIITDINKNKFESKEELKELRINVLKQRDLIIRIIKKQKLFDNKNFPYYTIALSLWGVVRNYYHLYTDVLEKSKKLPDFKVLKKVNDYFNESFDKINKLDIEEYLSRNKRYRKIYNHIMKDIGKNPLAAFCLSIITEIQLSDSSLYLINLK